MLPVQRAYVDAMRAGRTTEATEAAKRDDKISHQKLNMLRAQPCNSTCFDCSALKPGWAVLPHGIYVCIDCAQLHRNLGRHVSQTKAINTGTYLWFPHELRVMEAVGNEVAARAFANVPVPPKPSRDAPHAEKLAYVTAKYTSAVHKPEWERALVTDLVPPSYARNAPSSAARSATPTDTTSVSTTMVSAVPPKPRVALQGAKRAPRDEGGADLILFEDVAIESSTKITCDEAACQPACQPTWPSTDEAKQGAALADLEHERKKADVLSRFGVPQPQVPGLGSATFFAQFGL